MLFSQELSLPHSFRSLDSQLIEHVCPTAINSSARPQNADLHVCMSYTPDCFAVYILYVHMYKYKYILSRIYRLKMLYSNSCHFFYGTQLSLRVQSHWDYFYTVTLRMFNGLCRLLSAVGILADVRE